MSLMRFAEPSSARPPDPAPTAAPAGGPFAGPTTPGVVGEPEPDPVDLSFLDPSLEPGDLGRIAHYRVMEVIGVGGMGVVFRGEDTHLRRAVAIKIMRKEYVESFTSRERFLQEARVAAAVESENIVTIYQVGMHNDVPYLAMQFLNGEALDAKLNRQAPLPLPFALMVARQVAAGLADAHAHGLVHRDVKPANIWLEADTATGKFRRAKLLDFGLARIVDSNRKLTNIGVIVGTPQYMSPEQAFGTPVDGRADLFSLGAVMYAMLTGELPFTGNTSAAVLMALVSHTPPRVSARNRQVPAEIDELVARLLAKEPEQRPESAHEVVDALDSVLIEFSAPTLGRTSGVLGYPTRTTPLATTAGPPTQGATEVRGRTMIGGPQATVVLDVDPGAAAAPRPQVATGPFSPPSAAAVWPEPTAAPRPFPQVFATPVPDAGPASVVVPDPVGRPPRRISRLHLANWAVLIGLCGWAGYTVLTRPPAVDPSTPPVLAVPAASAAPQEVRVGVLFAKAGPMSALESSLADAVLMAVDELNHKGGVLGRRVVPVEADGGRTPEEYVRQAESLIRERGVTTLFGCPSSSDRRAVRGVVERYGGVLFYPGTHEGLEDSARIVYVGPTPSQAVVPAVRRLADGGAGRVFVVGTDNVFSRAVGAVLADALKGGKAAVVGQEFPPVGTTDFAAVVKAVRAADADVVVNAMRGGAGVLFVRQLRAAGPYRGRLLHLQHIEDFNNVLDPAETAGDYVACSYLADAPDAVREGFPARFRARYGENRVVTDTMAEAYTAVRLWAAAAEGAGSVDPTEVLKAVPRTTTAGPFGPLAAGATGRHFKFGLVLGRFGHDGRVAASHTATPTDPLVYPPSRSPQDWDRFLHQLRYGWGERWRGPEAK